MNRVQLPKSAPRTMMRGVVRGALKPILSPRIPIGFQRRWVAGLTKINFAPRGSEISKIDMNRVPAERQRPAGRAESALLYLHGGAYILGAAAGYRNLCGHLALASEACAYVPDYRLAPEHPYPAAVEDALTAYRWLLENGTPANRIAIAGDSAGGGLALATALALREAGDPMPAGLGLISPWVDLTMSSDSVRENADKDPMLQPGWGLDGGQRYAGALPVTTPGCSPLFDDLTGLPPMMIQVGSDEILLDDATRLAAKAEAAGVTTELEIFDDLWHVFHLHAGVLPESADALKRMGASLKRWLQADQAT